MSFQVKNGIIRMGDAADNVNLALLFWHTLWEKINVCINNYLELIFYKHQIKKLRRQSVKETISKTYFYHWMVN
jgi:hypothetical protein